MKSSLRVLLACLSFLPFQALLHGQDKDPVYELRTYYANPGKLDALHARFRDHTLKLFAKHGITSIGYWTPQPNPDNALLYVLSYPGREAREQMWKDFLSDPEWKAAYAASIAGGKLLARFDSEFLTATPYSPTLTVEAQAAPRQFELRRYTTLEGKLPQLDARFRDHTIKLFEKHGMNNLAYFHLMPDQEGQANTLVYLLAHRDDAARIASFAAFRMDPAWVAARDASERDGKLLVEKGVQSTILIPTDYSPLR